MIGILVQLAISWLIIWLFEKGNLSVLGFKPGPKRLTGFILFFFITAFCCASEFLIKILAGQEWKINPALSFNLIASGAWWNIKSVLFEELIFRGVLLYILINRMGAIKAIIISAAAFGIYHWFSFGIVGNIVQMAVVFIITGVMGLLLAYAYERTRSLYIPVAIHLGWNFTRIFIFSQGPIGDGLFIPVGPRDFRTDSLLLFLCFTFLPLLSALLINFLLIKRWKALHKDGK